MLGSCLTGLPGLLHRFVYLLLCHQSPIVVPHLQLPLGPGRLFSLLRRLLILTRYFKARLAFANGLIALGGAIGGSVLSPSMQQMLIYIGLANMFRVLAGAYLLLSVFSLVYRPKRRVLPHQNDVITTFVKKRRLFDWGILKNKAFLMWIVVVSIFMLGYMVPFVHLVRF